MADDACGVAAVLGAVRGVNLVVLGLAIVRLQYGPWRSLPRVRSTALTSAHLQTICSLGPKDGRNYRASKPLSRSHETPTLRLDSSGIRTPWGIR